jgi:hypothetical protein
MHTFGLFDLAGLAVAGFVIIKVFGPFASALAKRLEGPSVAGGTDPAVREELDELQERVDFLERRLASPEARAELPRHRTPT